MNVLIQPALARKLRRRCKVEKLCKVIRVKASTDGQSLPDLVRYFTHQDPQGKKAMSGALGADIVHPILLKRFRKALKEAGFEPKLLVLTGYKGTADASMPVALQELKPMAMSHAVVAVGRVIVDLCYKRMGEKYNLPQTYQEQRIMERWQHVQDVSKFAELTPEDVKRMHQLEQHEQLEQKKLSHEKEHGAMFGNGPLDFVPIT